jgi:hypothetical protein
MRLYTIDYWRAPGVPAALPQEHPKHPEQVPPGLLVLRVRSTLIILSIPLGEFAYLACLSVLRLDA